MAGKNNGSGATQHLSNMSYDDLAVKLQERAKAMMAAKNVNGAVVFGTLARRFLDAARELSTYQLNELAIANMMLNDPIAGQKWATEKLAQLEKEAKD